jgi:uncharacterized protein YbaP (TraB family)
MLLLGIFSGPSFAAQAHPDPDIPELETVVVSGEQPGPGLWKVSKGEHVMWVLAAYGPLPKGMSWNANKIEARIAESQEVLYAGGVNIGPNISLLRGLTLIPAAMKATKIPDGKTLKDVLSAETYGKWLAMRQKYGSKDDDVDRFRPAIALEMLRGEVLKKNDLQGGPNVYTVVGKLREKHRVPRNSLPTISRTVRVENPRGMLKAAQKMELPDVDCFTRGLDQLEPEVERMKTQANAWSRGDIEKLRSLNRNLTLKDMLDETCAGALMTALGDGDSTDSVHLKKTMADMQWHAELAAVQSQLDWVAAAKVALEKNQSTFALLSVGDVFRPDGHLAKLRELGYTVEEPL